MKHSPTFATTSWTPVAFSLSLVAALIVCLIVTAACAPYLNKRGRNDLLPWVVGVSLAVSLIVAMTLLLPRFSYVLVR